MIRFKEVYATACLHKGGEQAVEAALPRAKSYEELVTTSDDRYLSQMSLRIFRAGLKHEMVDKKWPAFEEVFRQFDPFYCAMLSDDDIDTMMQDARLIRHHGKMKSVRTNAQWLQTLQRETGEGFGRFLADWPVERIVELWATLKKHGTQLGGQSGAYFLRMVGKDTFILTRDVAAVLMKEGVLSKAPTAQREFKAAQGAFNEWRNECGRDLCEISRILSYTAL